LEGSRGEVDLDIDPAFMTLPGRMGVAEARSAWRNAAV
jgi:hypothetical protein